MNVRSLWIWVLACCLTATPALAWNQLPVPVINSSVTPDEQYTGSGNVVSLDGSPTSYDPDGYIVDYEWQVYKWNGSSYSYYGIQWGSPTSRRFTTPAKYRVDLYVQDNDDEWSSSSDSCYVTAVQVALSGGGYIGGIGGSIPISLSLEPSLTTGEVRLSKSRSGDGDVGVYSDAGLTNEVLLPKSWLLASESYPGTLYVKGTAGSSSLSDVTLTMSYVKDSATVDSDSEMFTVVNLQITSPTGPDRDIAFNSSSPGVCTITVTGTTGVSSLDQDLEWTMPQITGSSLASNPSPARGPNVTFTYTGLPSSNGGFGGKDLTLTLKNSQGATICQTIATIRLFFAKWGYNHDGGTSGTPNWYCYWKEGDAVPDLLTQDHEFLYDGTDPLNAGYWNPPTDQFYVCPLTADLTPAAYRGTWTWYNRRYQVSIHSGPDGICHTTKYGNDTQLIPYGYGQRFAIALIGGPELNDPIDTVCYGNDEITFVPGVGETLNTGSDGILDIQTQISPLDIRKEYQYYDKIEGRLLTGYIEPGKGRPWSTAVTYEGQGGDDWLDTEPGSGTDDKIDLTNAHSETVTFNETGIDRCASTCSHEHKHQELYTPLRYPGGPPYDYYPTPDSDFVDDSTETSLSSYHLCTKPQIGYDTYDLVGFWKRFFPNEDYGGDNEFIAYMTPRGPTTPGADWSDTDGQNWKQ